MTLGTQDKNAGEESRSFVDQMHPYFIDQKIKDKGD